MAHENCRAAVLVGTSWQQIVAFEPDVSATMVTGDHGGHALTERDLAAHGWQRLAVTPEAWRSGLDEVRRDTRRREQQIQRPPAATPPTPITRCKLSGAPSAPHYRLH